MTKRPGTGYDPRREDDEGGSAESYRVDRVYVPNTRERPQRPASSTVPPMGGGAASPEAELALRRQLSRLQRQLADAQRELANKEDELAAEVEKRTAMSASQAELEAELREAKTAVEDLAAYRARTAGIEQRLHERDAYVEELRTELERERGQQASGVARAEELTAELAAERKRAADERAKLERGHAEHMRGVETQKRTAQEEADKAFQATINRMRESQQEELSHLRDSYERQLQALRGELEPKALEARDLAEERERLSAQVEALKAENQRDTEALEEAHRRELATLEVQKTDEIAAMKRAHAVELGRISADRDAKAAAVTDAVKNGEQREQLWEQTVAGLRDAQKKAQLDLAEAKETLAQAEAERSSIEARLTMAGRAAESLVEENRALRERVEAAVEETRRNALDRQRFVAYLEEGLAMLGALPAKGEDPDEDSGAGDKE